MSYATIEDYENRFGVVSNRRLLQECLSDCSAAIDAAMRPYGICHIDSAHPLRDNAMRACRSMAHRIMPDEGAADIPIGVTQASFTAGPYNQQYTFAQTYGTPKLTDFEKSLLGIGGGRIGFGRLA